MPGITMDRFSDQQENILHQRVLASAQYPVLWKKMVAEWNASDPENRVWLTYSANYLFRTNNIRWAIDPLTLFWRLKSASPVDIASDLSSLSFVLLTHAHKDHLDLDLLSALKDHPIRWVVPEFMLSDVVTQAGLSPKNIIIAAPLNPISIHGMHILPFNGLHWEETAAGARRGVPALGYLIECNGRRWLFPGDTRTYNSTQLPAFPAIDVVFAHLWLGRGSALQNPPPLLNPFCRFFLDTSARRVIVTHLNELGRDADDYWDVSHIDLVSTRFQEMSADVPISHLVMGDCALL